LEGPFVRQEIIWDHFQNEGVAAFDESPPRLEFLVGQMARGVRALNIGVGNGGLERIATAKAVEVWSLDPNARAIDRLRAELAMGDRARTGFGQAMPFPDSNFDYVVMSEVLEHLADDVLEGTLDEVLRVLRPGGKLIGTVPAREQLSQSRVICPHCGESFHRWGHVRSFDTRSMRDLLATRFSVDVVEEHFFIAWESASINQKLQGLVKKWLSARRIGTYGACRNLFFRAAKAA
jgi:SAM-dependent methyltransferase